MLDAKEALTLPRMEDIRYFKYGLSLLPHYLTEYDTSRMAMAFYAISGIDICGAVEKSISEKNRKDWIEWVYAQQVVPSWDVNSEEKPDGASWGAFGFRGSPSSGRPFNPNQTTAEFWHHDTSHMAMTYTALLTLVILGDDLSRVNREAIIQALKHCQTESGSFIASVDGAESDMRFLFAACAISYILNDFRGVNTDRAVTYILKSRTYENAFAQGPGQESHGGSTYCAVASLALLGQLHVIDEFRLELIGWLLKRQQDDGGFAGRPGKVSDTCYSFWVGASLEILGAYQFSDSQANRKFLETTVSSRGGFSKHADANPDPLHSYMGLAGLSIAKEPGLEPLWPQLNITLRALNHLKNGTKWWTMSQ
ncbi:Geranylgeranyl transferase type-1 subunit beta [Rhizoclosmatium sp. JEL0117]|nr:Geranylgeranyl transferase type-1 subunit beta [Rhizoclosmatium sp. JEL0117]